ncbi:phosphoribosylglycinamide formyltransferase [Anaplasma platys]|uniref:Phosphoribosylglycinamide formyltransferase n=1 Tax=Anaplasma platys TaxID=949 RepID=A0A858PXK8_9RICK|nr:phosphoribosylglycinamide formyltransferase [Anaplasma platys]QJC27314.1 phosphoribosylglycinamide formyltransferase [Anaplasma platys]
MRIGVLISGRGSNLEALARACVDSEYPATIACVISNKVNAHGITIASQYSVPAFTVNRKPLDTEGISSILEQHKVELVCLAGFMSVLPAQFVTKWHGKIINIHPSLLPSFKGLKAQEQAYNAGVKVAGCTVHYVSPEVDGGPIILQAAVPVLNDDTVETLSHRILSVEHLCYPEAVRLIALGRVKIVENRVVRVKGNDELFLLSQKS